MLIFSIHLKGSVFQDLKENDDNKYKNSHHPVLNLYNVTEEDAGEYVCSVENTVGITFSASVKINVVCKNYFKNNEPHPFDIIFYKTNHVYWCFSDSPYCIDETIEDYGIGENDFVNLTCKVQGNPEPQLYRWVIINEKVNLSTFTSDKQFTIADTENDTFLFQRPNGTETGIFFITICIELIICL